MWGQDLLRGTSNTLYLWMVVSNWAVTELEENIYILFLSLISERAALIRQVRETYICVHNLQNANLCSLLMSMIDLIYRSRLKT